MCGIAGIVMTGQAGPAEVADVEAMTAALVHRGPDRESTVSRPGAVLGSARLAIVDLAGSLQPMTTPDGRYTICLNGEIFNYQELREMLERKGFVFRTKGDTEVALNCLADAGPDAFAMFNGQFAIAFYDQVERRLLLARDRYGICPLYYTADDDGLAFSSELRSLQRSERFRASSLDAGALLDMYVLWGFLPGESSLAGVHQVDPGCWLEVTPTARHHHAYWRPEPPEAVTISRGDAVQQLTTLLQAAVDRRLAPEVRFAVLLSGGLDSSALSALAQRTQDVMTFGIGFADSAYDESAEQRAVADHLGTDHRAITIANSDLIDEMSKVVEHSGMPLTRMAPVSTYILARELAAHDVRVVLTGEGADEMLLGYDIFKLTQARLEALGGAGAAAAPLLSELPEPERGESGPGIGVDAGDPADPCFSHLPRWQSGQRIRLYLRPQWQNWAKARDYSDLVAAQLPDGARSAHPLRRAQMLELATFLPTMLLGAQSDRMLMAHSVEGRYPFLDNDVVDFLLSLPIGLLDPNPVEKALLRESITPYLPESVWRRPKQAYTAPLRRTLALPEAMALFDTFLAPESLDEVGLFDPRRVAWLVARLRSGAEISGEDARALLFMVTTQMVHATHIRRK
jgi:asparagine synthase (glutamine-hydrolysing)